ncbi:hypothetical protein BHE74_00032508 [Ensete ventricosum]|nr:hypothetical protein BHE74_00032508 [Ensete ventricosum]RZS09872.1 hypothetical protein BHM03_00041003 [Ensete ventricosum]
MAAATQTAELLWTWTNPVDSPCRCLESFATSRPGWILSNLLSGILFSRFRHPSRKVCFFLFLLFLFVIPSSSSSGRVAAWTCWTQTKVDAATSFAASEPG